jgi:hypothetical protein
MLENTDILRPMLSAQEDGERLVVRLFLYLKYIVEIITMFV